MKLTKNFTDEEYECKCGCGLKKVSPTVALLCQMVRDKFNKPVTVLSGCRCENHNKNVGGAKNSSHLPDDIMNESHAADIRVDGVEPLEVYNFLDSNFPNSLGLGLYKSWVHLDDRIDKAYRW